MSANPAPGRIADIGCGRGSTTISLARQHPTTAVVAIDQSPALLRTVWDRATAQNRRVDLVTADFHHLPLAPASIDVAVAAFCLYHSPRPVQVAAEIARCLRPGGHLVLATKSAGSYHSIDTLIATSGLEPDAIGRPSLYHTFHTGNAEHVITAAGLDVKQRIDQEHVFRLADLAHLAEYAVTCPKYRLPTELTGDPRRLATALRERVPDAPVNTTSTVTYLLAVRP